MVEATLALDSHEDDLAVVEMAGWKVILLACPAGVGPPALTLTLTSHVLLHDHLPLAVIRS